MHKNLRESCKSNSIYQHFFDIFSYRCRSLKVDRGIRSSRHKWVTECHRLHMAQIEPGSQWEWMHWSILDGGLFLEQINKLSWGVRYDVYALSPSVTFQSSAAYQVTLSTVCVDPSKNNIDGKPPPADVCMGWHHRNKLP